MVKYIEDDNRYIIWENWKGRYTFYLSRKDYLAAQNCSTGFALKGQGYIWKDKERIWVLSLEQLEAFIFDIASQESN